MADVSENPLDLTGYSRDTLARWWCQMNVFRWPPDFPEPEPPDWPRMSDRQKHQSPEGRRAWRAINSACPESDALAYWRGPFDRGRNEAQPILSGT